MVLPLIMMIKGEHLYEMTELIKKRSLLMVMPGENGDGDDQVARRDGPLS